MIGIEFILILFSNYAWLIYLYIQSAQVDSETLPTL